MMIDIQNALTQQDCASALLNSKKLFDSPYTDNRVRMLYANALACRAGFRMYDVMSELTSFSSPNAIGQFPRVFPSTAGDQKLESGWLAQDVVQSILTPGSVVGAFDQISAFANNPGSVLASDRTSDSNYYGFYMSMMVIGNTLSRYGNTSATTGAGWGQGTDLVWTDKDSVKNDPTGSACGLASAFLNFIDGYNQVQASGIFGVGGAALGVMITGLDTIVVTGGTGACAASGGIYYCEKFYDPVGPSSVGTVLRCAQGKERLRYRGACAERDESALVAAGMLQCVNTIWL
ncbi:MAG: hypothetical protein EBX52_10360 [Proteobacteria bacterium]|nr:hypothetical protein [Pseudomonadota bacterium]